MNNPTIKWLKIDYYSMNECQHCIETKHLFKKEGVFKDVNELKDQPLPEGCVGYPCFVSKTTGKKFMGYPETLDNLISKLS